MIWFNNINTLYTSSEKGNIKEQVMISGFLIWVPYDLRMKKLTLV